MVMDLLLEVSGSRGLMFVMDILNSSVLKAARKWGIQVRIKVGKIYAKDVQNLLLCNKLIKYLFMQLRPAGRKLISQMQL